MDQVDTDSGLKWDSTQIPSVGTDQGQDPEVFLERNKPSYLVYKKSKPKCEDTVAKLKLTRFAGGA